MNRIIPVAFIGCALALAPVMAANADEIPGDTFTVSPEVCGAYGTYIVMTTTHPDGTLDQTHLNVSDSACPTNPQPDPFVPVPAPVAPTARTAAPALIPADVQPAPVAHRAALPGIPKSVTA